MMTVRDAIHALEQMPETAVLAIGEWDGPSLTLTRVVRNVEQITENVSAGRVVIL